MTLGPDAESIRQRRCWNFPGIGNKLWLIVDSSEPTVANSWNEKAGPPDEMRCTLQSYRRARGTDKKETRRKTENAVSYGDFTPTMMGHSDGNHHFMERSGGSPS